MHCKGLAMLQLLLLLLRSGITECTVARQVPPRSAMDGFTDGLKYAGQMLGINTAADVANLVAKAFSNTAASGNRRRPDFLSAIFQQRPETEQEYSEESQDTAADTQEQQEEATEAQQATQQRVHNKSGTTPAKEVVGGLDFATTSFITNVLRMIGFDASKLGALAINALVMIAQAIGNTFMAATKRKGFASVAEGGPHRQETGPEALYGEENAHQPRELRDDTPIDWFMHEPQAKSKKLKGLLRRAGDAKLPDQLLDMIGSLEGEMGQGACLKLLMCKSAPFIWGMQKSLAQRMGSDFGGSNNTAKPPGQEDGNTGGGALNPQVLFTHLPSLSEYRAHGADCEQRFTEHCNTTLWHGKRSN